MRTIVVALALAFVPPPVSAEPPVGQDQCFQPVRAATTIRACTAIIQSGQASPDDVAEAHFARAAANRQIGQIDQAISDYTDGIALSTSANSKYIAYLNRGDTYERIGRHADAIADYNSAISNDPNGYPAYWSRAKVYQLTGLHDQAIADFTRAIALHPNFQELYVGRALSYETLGRREEAIADYRIALNILPSSKAAQDGLRRLTATP